MSEINEHTEFLYSLKTGVFRKLSARDGVKCERCDGRGKEPCVECCSSGKVWKRCDHCSSGGSRVDCPKCAGRTAACHDCKGTGRVSHDAELKAHPADVWTVRAIRKLSVNGSFR
jgi:DnaJ-class molecular chaperone